MVTMKKGDDIKHVKSVRNYGLARLSGYKATNPPKFEPNEADLVRSGLANRYGEICVIKHNDKFYLGLENWSGWGWVEVSEKFYLAFAKEFKGINHEENPNNI